MVFTLCGGMRDEVSSVKCVLSQFVTGFHSGQSANHCAGLLPVPEVSNFSEPRILLLTELVLLLFTLRALCSIQYTVLLSSKCKDFLLIFKRPCPHCTVTLVACKKVACKKYISLY